MFGVPSPAQADRRDHLEETVRCVRALVDGRAWPGGSHVPAVAGPTPDILDKMARLEDAIRRLPEVRKVTGLPDLLARVKQLGTDKRGLVTDEEFRQLVLEGAET